MRKGFTLIELLVVVLIIGILSAIALPQYQRVVLKARMAEIGPRVKTMETAAELYILENGFPAERIYLADLDSDMMGGLIPPVEGKHNYKSKYVSYDVYCYATQCTLLAFFNPKGDFSGSTEDIIISEYLYSSNHKWDKYCLYKSANTHALALCKMFEGYQPTAN